MRTKIDSFMCSVTMYDYDILVLTETWLNEEISNAELNLSNYTIFRKDRSAITSSKLRGGGVLIAVRKKFSTRFIQSSNENIEKIFVKIKIDRTEILVGGVYLPPGSNPSYYEDHCSSVDILLEKFPQHKLYLFGDYNLPKANWNNDELGVCVENMDNHSVKVLCDGFAYHNLFQNNKILNCQGSMLDLLFTHDREAIPIIADDCLLPCDSYHPAWYIEIPFNTNFVQLDYDCYYFDYKNANYVGLNDYLCSISWDTYLSNEMVMIDIDSAINLFYDLLFEGINLFVPKTRSRTPKFPRWYSKQLKDAIFEKKKAHKKYKLSQNWQDYQTFSSIRAHCKELNKVCYNDYIRHTENALGNDLKGFWNFINAKRRDSGLPQEMYLNDAMSSDGNGIVDLFAQQFQSVYKPNIAQNNPECNHCCKTLDISTCEIGIGEVVDKLATLDINKGPGPDGIPPRLLNYCRFSLAKPLHLLFNESLTCGIFPAKWKSGYITPIYKSGDNANISNYRPITILSTIPKMFEDIVCDHIKGPLMSVTIDEQHGFCRGRSTTTNLLLFVQYILDALEDRFQVDAIYTDISKAFDSVNHVKLCQKLEMVGFIGPMLRWLSSYLLDRTQIVKVKGFLSGEIHTTSGVPQGSHLGPLLFNIFINDLKSVVEHCKILLFADDLRIFTRINTVMDCHNLQTDLNHICEWFTKNNLDLNINKCKSISFSRSLYNIQHAYKINDEYLEGVSSIRDLGVLLDTKMDFNLHYNHIVNKARKMLGFICRATKDFTNTHAIKLIYYTLVRSLLDYASCVWSPSYDCHINDIEKVQNKFIRFLAYKLNITTYEHSSDEIRAQTGIQKLSTRRNESDLKLLYKIIHSNINCPDLLSQVGLHVPPRSTRSNATFAQPFHRCNYGKNSPVSRILASGNKIDLDFFHIPFNKFRNELRFIDHFE